MRAYTRTVKASELRAGDTFTTGDWVTEVYNDAEGTWLATSDGDEGYVNSVTRYVLED
jgi:hypothetical protein